MARPVWFKRKTYGWGWTPATWQGWAILGIYTGGFITLISRINTNGEPQGKDVLGFFLPLLGLTLFLLIITYLTGERPHWQWGKQRDEK